MPKQAIRLDLNSMVRGQLSERAAELNDSFSELRPGDLTLGDIQPPRS